LRTPGHTGESTCYLLDEGFLFTGDTLFEHGVGRPDLQGGREQAAALAHELYHAVQRLLSYPDPTLVLASHSAEVIRFDGKPLCTSLGKARAANRLLSLGETGFVRAIVASIPETPPNFAEIVRHNEAGMMPPGDPAAMEAGANRCAVA
jgi:glyoxylase-like metal-dependent hydrolase (beta-lactamase superfamily II)